LTPSLDQRSDALRAGLDSLKVEGLIIIICELSLNLYAITVTPSEVLQAIGRSTDVIRDSRYHSQEHIEWRIDSRFTRTLLKARVVGDVS